MRGTAIIFAVIVTVSLGLGCGEALATVHQIPTMLPGKAPRADFAQFQAQAIDWLWQTVKSTEFIVGTLVGVIVAVVGRFLMRWGLKFFGVAALSLGFVIRHRLLTAGLGAGLYYVAVFRPFG